MNSDKTVSEYVYVLDSNTHSPESYRPIKYINNHQQQQQQNTDWKRNKQ